MIIYIVTRIDILVETPSGRVIEWHVPTDESIKLYGQDSAYMWAYRRAMKSVGRATIIELSYDVKRVGFYDRD